MHIEVLVEDSSGARLMEHLLPKILGDEGSPHTWRIHSYKGVGRIPKNMTLKSDPNKKSLLDNLPRLLAGYGNTPGYDAVLVLVDTDDREPHTFRSEIQNAINACLLAPKTLIGLATEEIEAWYLGDRVALDRAYSKILDPKPLQRYHQDSVCGTWELLADALVKGGAAAIKKEGWQRAGELKHEWANKIGPLMNTQDNKSPSFQVVRNDLVALIA